MLKYLTIYITFLPIMSTENLLAIDERDRISVKNRLYLAGETVAEWSRKNGFAERDVYAVLSGRSKATRGQTHLVAIALGLKPGGSTPSGPDTILTAKR